MNLAISKLSSLLDECLKILGVQHITRDSKCLAARLVDLVCDFICLSCFQSVLAVFDLLDKVESRTSINIRDNHFSSFIGKKTSCFSADTLSRTGDDSYLTCKETTGVVEVIGDLSCALCHCG